MLNFWCEIVSGVRNTNTNYDTGKEVQYDDLFKQSTYQNWDFENIWQIQEGATTPYLKWLGDPPEEVKKSNIDNLINNNN